MANARSRQSPSALKKKTKETTRIESTLRSQFPESEAYRYHSASIRVRIIDERFEMKSLVEREAMVRPLIRTLPEATQADILMLLLLTPAERKDSLLNVEFERPSPTRL
jgi:stress-induced morphogen